MPPHFLTRAEQANSPIHRPIGNVGFNSLRLAALPQVAVSGPPSLENSVIEPDLIRSLRRKLLSWYRKHQRKLPWRATAKNAANPYHVLVSEAMLQQTQVATVIDYFHRFVTAFPTLESLAKADEQAVLKLWEGLGYYRRARHLHKAAKVIMAEHGGEIPRNAEALETLPGVGRYTAGAIASIAFAQQAPILDGNVARVLARWFAIEDAIDDAAVKKQLWQLAETMVPKSKPGDFNQAMMELGALVCLPKKPGCLACPIASECEANQQGKAEALPRRIAKRKPTAVTHHVFAIAHGSKYLFQQRPDTGLWSRLWQLFTIEEELANGDPHAIAMQVKALTGLDVSSPSIIHEFKHQTTHRTIQFKVWHCTRKAGRLKKNLGTWMTCPEGSKLPLAKPQQNAIKLLTAFAD